MAQTDAILPGDQAIVQKSRLFRSIAVVCLLIFTALIAIPLLEACGRTCGYFNIPGAATWIQNLVLWLGFLAAILTTLQDRHLSIGIVKFFQDRPLFKKLEYVRCLVHVSILLALSLACFIFVRFQIESPERIGRWIPIWVVQTIMPIAFLMIAWALVTSRYKKWSSRLIVTAGAVLLCLVLYVLPESARALPAILLIGVIILLSLWGLPIYAMLGGIGILLFYSADIPIAALPVEANRILTQPVLPSIPLFALAGTVLAAGGAPKRLITLITAWTGWMRGGPVFAAVLGCAIFTAITGASGVTILALGSLLLPVLMSAHYDKKFSIGLLTSSGSIGLMFPPSLPVILFGVYAHVAIDQLFLAALLPGILLVIFVAVMSLLKQSRMKAQSSFDVKLAFKSVWAAKGDIAFPFFIFVGLFGGFLTLVETAALTALWALLLETVFHQQIKFKGQLLDTLIEASVLSGALLIVLGLASGFSSYLVDMQIPSVATEFVLKYISSKYVFLLVLNVVLLMVGAVMDIYSAILIVVPLIVPIGAAFGIHPVHLGIIFLANLELGYLTPPIGMNLFLASLRFEETLLSIWKTVLPFLILFVVWVILITYVPFISIGILNLVYP
jgi:tripartite ATP-independent transporter DctM subunit